MDHPKHDLLQVRLQTQKQLLARSLLHKLSVLFSGNSLLKSKSLVQPASRLFYTVCVCKTYIKDLSFMSSTKKIRQHLVIRLSIGNTSGQK